MRIDTMITYNKNGKLTLLVVENCIFSVVKTIAMTYLETYLDLKEWLRLLFDKVRDFNRAANRESRKVALPNVFVINVYLCISLTK